VNDDRTIRCAAADLGAGSGRVITGEIVRGRLELSEAYRFKTPLRRPGEQGSRSEGCDRYFSWDVDAIEKHVLSGIRAAASRPLTSVGVDSWGVDYVLLDEPGRRVGCCVSYRDPRTEGMMERVFARIPREDIYRRTGIQFQPFNTIYQLAATSIGEPPWLASARRLLMVPDYLHYRLSDVPVTETTNASTTQCLALSGDWDGELLAAVGVDPSLMGQLVEAGTMLGEMTAAGAPAGVKVIAPPTHDTASAVAGAPLESIDEAYISSGTWSLMGIESLQPLSTPVAMRMNVTNERGYARRFRVLKNIMGLWLIQRVSQEMHVVVDDALIAAARAAAPWRSIVNPDDGRFLNPASMSDSIRAYCRETGQPEPAMAADLARCVFDSLALSYRYVKEELEELRGSPLSKIRIVGGGSKNGLLNQLCADACGIPVSAGPTETSAIGNICVQLVALGALQNLGDARRIVRESFPITDYTPCNSVPDSAWSRFRHITAPRIEESFS
jgi:rhamnulokinase